MTREDEIFRLIRQGKQDSLDELVRMYYPEIFRYCFWHTSNRADAEDATQETFLKVVRYLDRYTHKGKFRAFLYQVAANTCIDISRRKCEEPVRDDLLDAVSSTDDGIEKAIGEEDFMNLIRQLPECERELVFLRFGQDLKLREIAAITGMPLRTVQSRLRKAMKQLRENILLNDEAWSGKYSFGKGGIGNEE